MKYKPLNILVTGGLGFIGTNFIEFFLEKYNDVSIINIDNQTYAANKKLVNNKINYEFIKGDICDKNLVNLIIKNNKIDTIINFAAESHVDKSINNPRTFIETNVLGTYSLLECAKSCWDLQSSSSKKKYRFHHISTDEVYGSLKIKDFKFKETNKYFPNSPYSASKAGSDHLVRAWHETYGLPITISNCSNNYGPYQHSEKFIPTIIDACKNKKVIPIYGEGNNIRDWLHVYDHCKAIDLIIRSSEVGQTYNVGGNCELRNIDVATLICKFFNENFDTNFNHLDLVEHIEDRQGHDFRYAVDINNIQNDLGWSPSINFEEGIIETIKWYL
tara:strand:+ start:25463 stop:26455 length:993 start_codon:yes stop_codon:yes gene_type:complete